MSIFDTAQTDLNDIMTRDGECVVLTFTAPTAETAEVKGFSGKHHLAINPEGAPVSSKTSYANVPEKEFDGTGYPLRNAKGEVDIDKHKVSVKDSTGSSKNYIIIDADPDETIGLISMHLSDA